MTDKRVLEALTVVYSCSKLLLMQMNDMLDTALLENSVFIPKLEYFRVKQAVEDVLIALKLQAEFVGT